MPETTQLLPLLAGGLVDEEQVIRGERGRDEGLGYDGMRKLVRGLMNRAGLPGFTSHTLATLVTERSDELTIAMQLRRDRVPRVAMRYVKSDLLALLERYSPLR